MVFNSLEFAIFFPAVFLLYWIIGGNNRKAQNLFLLGSSYFFYAWWDWRFLSLLVASSGISYWIGNQIHQSSALKNQKLFLYLGIIFSLSVLLFFKYYNFFIENFAAAFSLFGQKIPDYSLRLILPLGISFYTFKLIGYLLDVYWKKVEPAKSWIDYFTFIGFFAQLTAGPIDRASNLLSQLQQNRKFNDEQSNHGIKLVLWGLFKKVVVADTCAIYVSDIYTRYDTYPASVLLLGTVYFAFQVYADFSGYSDMAIGFGKLLGLEMVPNFQHPFISRNITEFWRRWHISLSAWFNDYIFTPIYTALRNWGNAAMYLGILITFLLSGLWHGASWHYVFFGALHGLAIIFETYSKKRRKSIAKKLPKWLYDNISMLLTFGFVLITWIFFRANDMAHAFHYLEKLVSPSLFEIPGKLAYLPLVAIMVLWEWIQRKRHAVHALDFGKLYLPVRWSIYLALTISIFYYYGEEQQFYYFQF